MVHRDLPAEPGWYNNQYAHEASGENPFGISGVGERHSNSELQEYLRLGGSLAALMSRENEEFARERVCAMLDRALAGKGGAL